MTDAEERALNLFIRMVAEFNDAQEEIDRHLKLEDWAAVIIANQLNAWTNNLRAGESQESLNELALELVGSLQE